MIAIVQSIPGLWLQLLLSAAFILLASNYLAKSADVISFRTGLGRSFIGVVLLATATSLPELGTGVSSIILVDAPDLAAGDAFGSNLFNLFIIGIIGMIWLKTDFLHRVSVASVYVGTLGILVISVAAIAMYMHGATDFFIGWPVSPLTLVLFAVFICAMYILYLVEKTFPDDASEENRSSTSLMSASLMYLAAAVVIIAAAVWLANTGEAIAHAMNWEASFVGTQFLAFSTSLPELAASIAAIRINAHELAFANVLGSNLFNMGFVLVIDDVVLVGTPLWDAIAPIHAMTISFAILMTSVIVLIGIVSRMPINPNKLLLLQSSALIALYIIASIFVFSFA